MKLDSPLIGSLFMKMKNKNVDELLDISDERIAFMAKDISDKHLLENISSCSASSSPAP